MGRLLVLSLAMATSPSGLAGQAPPVEVGRVDYRWSVRDLRTGEVGDLARYRGRVLFLNVWAAWCRACIEEMPSIQALHDSLAAEGIAVLALAADRPGPVARFLRRGRHTLPVALEEEAIPRSLGVLALPTTLIVDREGRIVLRHRGAADWDTAEVRAFLRALMALPARTGMRGPP